MYTKQLDRELNEKKNNLIHERNVYSYPSSSKYYLKSESKANLRLPLKCVKINVYGMKKKVLLHVSILMYYHKKCIFIIIFNQRNDLISLSFLYHELITKQLILFQIKIYYTYCCPLLLSKKCLKC